MENVKTNAYLNTQLEIDTQLQELQVLQFKKFVLVFEIMFVDLFGCYT